MVTKSEITLYQRSLWICNTIFHQAVGVVTVYILWLVMRTYKLDQNFTWHLILCTIAYVPLMCESIILFGGDNLWSQNMDRTKKYWVHGVILLLSCVSVSVGILVLTYEMGSNAKHFRGIHAQTGLVSWVLLLLSVILGLFAAKAQNLSSLARPVYFKFLHNLIGIAGYVIGVVSLGYGIYLRSFAFLTTPKAQLACVIVLGFITFWSLLTAFKSLINQMKSIVAR